MESVRVELGWDAVPLAGRPHLAVAVENRSRIATTKVEWVDPVQEEGGMLRVRTNHCQIFRFSYSEAGLSLDVSPIEFAVRERDRLTRQFADTVEMHLEHGIPGDYGPGNHIRTMAGVRHILGRGFRPGEDRLSLRTLREPVLLVRDERWLDHGRVRGSITVELLAEFTVQVDGVPAVKPRCGGFMVPCSTGCARCVLRPARSASSHKTTIAYDFAKAKSGVHIIAFIEKELNMSNLKSTDLKVGDKIRLKPGVVPNRTSNAYLLTQGREYTVRNVTNGSVDVDAQEGYNGRLNLANRISLASCEKVPATASSDNGVIVTREEPKPAALPIKRVEVKGIGGGTITAHVESSRRYAHIDTAQFGASVTRNQLGAFIGALTEIRDRLT